MLVGACIFTLTVTAGAVWSWSEAAAAPPRPRQPAWRIAESQHFEIHYLPELAPELERAVRAGERAYRAITERLKFVLPTKVPVVLFAHFGSLTREQVVAYATSDAVAPPEPHRSRIVVPVPKVDAELDRLVLHELTHLLVSEIISPGVGGDGGVPRWVHEGIASYMAGAWSDDQDRLMRDLVASGDVPGLSQLSGSGGFANVRLNDALGHVAFDFIESRWGPGRIRRFLDSLAAPRAVKMYEAVFGQTPAEFDEAFREYVEGRFRSAVR